MAQCHSKPKVALKFCGCCNPYVDLSKIARHLREGTETSKTFQLVSLSQDAVDAVVILCGCLRACGNRPEVRVKAKQTLVIAGESVNGKAVPEAHISAAVDQELIRILGS